LPRQFVRNSIPIYVMGDLPAEPSQQRAPTKAKSPLLASKLDKVSEREYIRKGYIKGFIDYFDVPKGPEDIRVVR
jgi:hypothetical protein